MLGHRPLTPEDYLDIVRRRFWILAIPVIVMPLIAALTTKLVPARYVSTALILFEQKQVPDEIVKSVVTSDLNSRVASLREQVMSRSFLEPIINNFQLYANRKIGPDEKLDLMRKAIDIKVVRNELVTRANGLPGFTITFTGEQPKLAQDVCAEITSVFMRASLRDRQAAVEGTTDFVRTQLDEARRSLDEQDAKLAAFEREHFGEMPEQEQSNIGMISSLTTQLDATTQRIDQLEQQYTYLQAIQTQTEPDNPQADPAAPTASEMETQLQKLVEAESMLQARYTADYPDMVKLRRDIDLLRKRIAAAQSVADSQKTVAAGQGSTAQTATATQPAKTPNRVLPRSQQRAVELRAQLQAIQHSIEEQRKEQSRLHARISEYQAKVQSSPAVQEAYKKVSRDYQTALQFYNDLLTKRNHSEMATDLERKQQGEQFRVLDAPNLPDSPLFPKMSVFLAGGAAAGLAIGMAIVAFLEYKDRTVRTMRDIMAFTQLPTLAEIPIATVAPIASGGGSFLTGRFRKQIGAPKG
jgi:polysaccharide chain length determinant protein (PEP-CTERM system associated)